MDIALLGAVLAACVLCLLEKKKAWPHGSDFGGPLVSGPALWYPNPIRGKRRKGGPF